MLRLFLSRFENTLTAADDMYDSTPNARGGGGGAPLSLSAGAGAGGGDEAAWAFGRWESFTAP